MFLASCAGVVFWSVNRLVEQDASSRAQAWSHYLSANLSEIDNIAAGLPLTWNDSLVIGNLQAQGEIVWFRLATPDGRVVYDDGSEDSGGVALAYPSPSDPAISRAAAGGEPFVEITRVLARAHLPRIVARIAVPIVKNGTTELIANIVLDQTGRQAIYRDHSLTAGAVLACIVLIAFGIPSALLMLRVREVEEKDAQLVEQNRRLNAVLENMSQGFCMFDADQRLLICNRRYADIYHLTEEMVTPGTPLRTVLERRIAQGNFPGGDPKAYIEERFAAVTNAMTSRSTQELPDGRTVAVSHRPLPDGGWLTTHDDITELRRIEQQITHMAHHDVLTDLPNRALFRKRVHAAVPLAQRGNGFAVLCLGLDHFKSVNDSLGHPAGDELLKLAAARLRDCMRQSDTVARLGGDEFAIVQVPVQHPDEVTSLAARLCEVMRKPFTIDGHEVMVDVSIGISMAPADGHDPDRLLKNADMALYRAKGDGRGVYRFFESQMDERMKARRQLELDLRQAVQEAQFELYYQPLFRARDARLTGFEALLRWRHPERGMVPPGEFVPLAEDIGLIVQIGEWALREACTQAARWPGDIKMAVNLSAAQFKGGGLVSTVMNALAASGLEAERLELEITETALLDDGEATLRTLHVLRGLGVRIAMDDFGTGYSSLSYLRSFPFDKIKLDGSFIKDLNEREDGTAIIRAVSGLGRSLGMTTTAEGVETIEQLDKVRAEGYCEVQGYYYSPPRPAAEIETRYFSDMCRIAANG